MLPDLLAPNLKLVVCGSAVGAASAMRGAYYAGPGNQFWRTLTEVGLTPIQLTPTEFPRLLEFGIGLTDLIKDQSGADAAITFGVSARERLATKLRQYRPRYLCFNGKRAAREYFGTKTVSYGLQASRVGVTALFVAPSTSGAARAFWDESVWQDLANLLGAA